VTPCDTRDNSRHISLCSLVVHASLIMPLPNHSSLLYTPQNDRMIKDLKQEIERLKQQLAQGGGAGGAGGGGTADPEVERKLQEMEAAQRNAWDEKERLSRALEEERQANMHTVITQVCTCPSPSHGLSLS